MLCWLVVVNAFLAGASPVQSMMVGLSTENLSRDSELVVLGDVGDTMYIWSDDGKAILTSAVIVINEVIKGHYIDRTIQVEYPGGELDGIGLKVSDEPDIKKGEKVVLFLKRSDKVDRTSFHLVGKAQGKYHIDQDGIARKGGFSIAGDPGIVDANIPLEVLLTKIRSVK